MVCCVAVVVVGGCGGDGEVVKLDEVKHVVFDGCVEGVCGEGQMADAVAVYSRIAGWRVGDRVGYQAYVCGGVGEVVGQGCAEDGVPVAGWCGAVG